MHGSPTWRLRSPVAHSSSTAEGIGCSSLRADKLHRLIIWKRPPSLLPSLSTALSLWMLFWTCDIQRGHSGNVTCTWRLHLGESEHVMPLSMLLVLVVYLLCSNLRTVQRVMYLHLLRSQNLNSRCYIHKDVAFKRNWNGFSFFSYGQ